MAGDFTDLQDFAEFDLYFNAFFSIATVSIRI